jgi:hypothetical protein
MTTHRLPSNIGGEPAGSIDIVDRGMKFWQGQANALRSSLTRKGIMKTDELGRGEYENQTPFLTDCNYMAGPGGGQSRGGDGKLPTRL